MHRVALSVGELTGQGLSDRASSSVNWGLPLNAVGPGRVWAPVRSSRSHLQALPLSGTDLRVGRKWITGKAALWTSGGEENPPVVPWEKDAFG